MTREQIQMWFAPIFVTSIFGGLCLFLWLGGEKPPPVIREVLRPHAPQPEVPTVPEEGAPPEPQPHFAPSASMQSDGSIAYYFVRGNDRRWHIMGVPIEWGTPNPAPPQIEDNR